MKHILIQLLNDVTPSRTIVNNCLALIQREQVGIGKYGKTLPDAGLTHEQLLQHYREEMLDGANYAEAALHTARQSRLDHAELLGLIEQQIQAIDRIVADPNVASLHPGMYAMKDALKDLLNRHETARTYRAVRDS